MSIFKVKCMVSTCLLFSWSLLHAGSRLCLFHWLSPCPALCLRTPGDRGGLACAECFGLVPSAGELGLPVAAPLLVDCTSTWRPFLGRCCGVSRRVRGPLWVSLAVATWILVLLVLAFRLGRAWALFALLVAPFGGWPFHFFTHSYPFVLVSFHKCNFTSPKKKKKVGVRPPVR
jgi:hypothetical protein